METKALTTAAQAAMSVSYEVGGVPVQLDANFVKQYLTRGNGNVTDQEVIFFLQTCMAQGLNPLVSGEVYLIKYKGDVPAQIVVGKNAYLKRAFAHPDYIGKQDGIIVLRGKDIVQKEGACLYPGETLLGGWCRVTYSRNGGTATAYKEVELKEYNSGQANWKTKPAMMINKVAVSQCLREAFPESYSGLYADDEMQASGAIPAAPEDIPLNATETVVDALPVLASKEQRKSLIALARDSFGETGDDKLKEILGEFGLSGTKGMTVQQFENCCKRISELTAEQNVIEVDFTEVDENEDEDGGEDDDWNLYEDA